MDKFLSLKQLSFLRYLFCSSALICDSFDQVHGVEDIGKTIPVTPLTSRKTTARKTTKPESYSIDNEPRTSLGLARPCRAPLTENTSEPEIIPKTPARTSRKIATGTSVSRKIISVTKEENDGREKEIPVVTHGHSTRRSTRLLQKSEHKILESFHNRGGRREAIKIDMLSEEENDDLMKESESEVTETIQNKNEGKNLITKFMFLFVVSTEE